MGKVRRPDATEKAAIVADHKAGMTFRDVAAKWGVSKATVHRYVDADRFPKRRPSKAERRDAEYALTGGRWVADGLVQRWEPFVAPSVVGLSDQQRRVEWEDAMFDEEQARNLHARYANGCREDRTVVGERVYQRRKKRAAAKKKAEAA